MEKRRAVIICATPRSGSTLLCDLLAATSVCGWPQSFFRRQSIPDYVERFAAIPAPGDPGFGAAYLGAVLRQGTDESGTFGVRLMWQTVPELSALLEGLFPGLGRDAERLERAFGICQFIHLSRRDTVAQAVSRLKAEQSELWHLAADGGERERTGPHRSPVYDRDALARFIEEAHADDAAWRGWFDANQLVPRRLSYEELAQDPQAALRRLLRDLGRQPTLADRIAPATAKMADRLSLDWARQFRADRDPEDDAANADEHPLA